MTSVTPSSDPNSPTAAHVDGVRALLVSRPSAVPDTDTDADADTGTGTDADGDGDAAMGYEPRPLRGPASGYANRIDCGSESDCGSRIVPSRNCLKWAESLHALLNDADGLNLFQQFLQQEDPDRFQMLEFWLACKGLSKQPPARAHQLVRVIYAQLFLKAQLGIEERLRRSITQRIKNDVAERKLLSPAIFNEACAVVERTMHEVMHPNFLSSDIYLNYVQKMQTDFCGIGVAEGCPVSPSQPSREAPAVSEQSNNVDSQSVDQQPLPVLHEDEELTLCGVSSTRRRGTRSTSLSSALLQMDAFPTKLLRQFGNVSRSNSSRRLYNYSYNPVSRQDSELQSLSSDARTDSMSDLSLDEMACAKETYAHKRQFQRQLRSMRENANMNKNSDLVFSLLPRTSNPHARESAKPLQPEEFAKHLIFKLEKLKKEREVEEIVVHKLNTVEHLQNESSATCGGGDVSSHQDLSEVISVQRNEDDSQEILDNHLARVWSDKTPRRSPNQGVTPIRCKSPDGGRKAWPVTCATPTAARPPHSYIASGIGAARKKDKDLCSLFSSDSGNGTDPAEGVERRHRGGGGSGGLILVKSKSMPEQNESYMSEYIFGSGSGTGSFFGGVVHCSSRGAGKTWSSSRRTLTDSGVSVVSGSRVDNITSQSPQYKEKLVSSWLLDNNRICGNRTATAAVAAAAATPPAAGLVHSVPGLGVAVGTAATVSTVCSGATCTAMIEENDSAALPLFVKHKTRWNTFAHLPHSSSRSKTGNTTDSKGNGNGNGSGGSGSSASCRNVLPGQPFVADPSMPPFPFHSVDTDTQLEETRRRLKEMGPKLNRLPTTTTTTAVGGSSKSCESSCGAGPAAYLQTSSKTEPCVTHRTSTLTRTNRKAFGDESCFTTVVYNFSDEQMPYLSRIPGNPITLRQFKDYMPKKGRYRYYFVTPCEDLEMQPIQEEITEDCEFLPLWKGKVIAQIRAID